MGYRFLADEYIPGGLTLAETIPFAKRLADLGVAYLSVMTGCYDSFNLPSYVAEDRKEAFMAPFAHAIKKELPALPIIAAGRIQTLAVAERVLGEGMADLVGLGRILLRTPCGPKRSTAR